jgi:arylsulfatase A-like enzyme
MDQAVGRLLGETGVLADPTSAIIFLADHGGGGAVPNDHDSAHPHDLTIPIIVGGGRVVPGRLPAGSSPLDVCATIPWVLGVTPPPAWQGRPLREAFGSGVPAASRSLEVAA